VTDGPDLDWAAFERHIGELTPGRKTSGLFFGWPNISIDIEANNQFVSEQVRSDKNSRGQMLVTPSMDPEYIRETVRKGGFAGLKCYHVWSTSKPTFLAHIPDYLPEEQVRIAHEEGLSITLHMVRDRAIADPSNQEVIRTWATRYPNARFILAHAARGFNPHHTIEGIPALKGLRNVWCDTSAVTDSGAFEAIVRTMGVDRLLYGADMPVCHMRGRCVAIGDSFLWLSPDTTKFAADYAEIRPSMIGHESLRVLKLACWNLNLSDSDVEKIFWNNAAEMYGLSA
jgi:glutamate-1-semialdehyde 2,1-aminomutase